MSTGRRARADSKGAVKSTMDMKTIVDEVIEETRARLEDSETNRGGPAMELTALVEAAKSQLAGVTGLKPIAVSGVAHEEGRWRVRIDMLEMGRIPPSSDVIGEYEVHVNEDGTMARFERRRTRHRGDVSQEVGV